MCWPMQLPRATRSWVPGSWCASSAPRGPPRDVRRYPGAALVGAVVFIAVLALSAMPPFGLFRSEFQIVAGGLAHARNAATVALVCLVTLAFLGLTVATARILSGPGPIPRSPTIRC